jgi:hypothetical protein
MENLVSKPVKDTYGRYVGFVVGFSVDTSGDLKSVGVDRGNGVFTEFPSERCVSAPEGFIVIPSWKVDSESLGKEIEGIKRRAKALQDLAHDGEVPRGLFEEMMGKYSEEAEKIQESYKTLAEEMVVRVQELDMQRESLDRFLVNVKVQYRAGEIDEGAYTVASECCQAMQKKNAVEREEIGRILKFVTEPLPGQTESNVKRAQVQAAAQASTE